MFALYVELETDAFSAPPDEYDATLDRDGDVLGMAFEIPSSLLVRADEVIE